MEILILNIIIQYVSVGLICAAGVDLVIRVTKSTEPFTFMEILGTIVAWPVILGTIINAYISDHFNQ
jgi:hypothetical protein